MEGLARFFAVMEGQARAQARPSAVLSVRPSGFSAQHGSGVDRSMWLLESGALSLASSADA